MRKRLQNSPVSHPRKSYHPRHLNPKVLYRRFMRKTRYVIIIKLQRFSLYNCCFNRSYCLLLYTSPNWLRNLKELEDWLYLKWYFTRNDEIVLEWHEHVAKTSMMQCIAPDVPLLFGFTSFWGHPSFITEQRPNNVCKVPLDNSCVTEWTTLAK